MRIPLDLAGDVLQAVGAWFAGETGDSTHGHGDKLLSRRTERHIDEIRKRWGVPGMAVAVVTSPRYRRRGHHAADDKVEAQGKQAKVQLLTFGVATNDGAPVDANSLFSIASNTKLFTALSVFKMIDDGVTLPSGEPLSLATKVKDVLPEWGLQDGQASEGADVADLMSMRSGLGSHDFSYADVSPADTVRNMRNLRPSVEFRQTFQYQNGHYVALSHMVPTLTGTPFVDYVGEHFFKPLGLNSTTFNYTEAAASGHRTDGHTSTGVNMTTCVAESKGARKRSPACHGHRAPFGWFLSSDGLNNAGPGGIVSSIRDVSVWLVELLDPRVVPTRLIEEAAKPRTILTGDIAPPGSDGLPSLYGAGQVIQNYRGHRIVSHTGGVPGQLTLILRVPEAGVGVSILTNHADVGYFAFQAAVTVILDELLGLKPQDTEQFWFDTYLSIAPGAAKLDGKEPEYGFEAVPGYYNAPGYITTLDLKPLDAQDPWHARFQKELPFFGAANRTVFVAPMDHVFSTHIVFSHWDGPHFNWTIFIAHDHRQGFGKGTRGTGPAVITKDGIGMFGGFSVPGADAPKREVTIDNVEETCEVWFKRT